MVESAPIPRIYLDVCCLNRPFDDQHQDRIRLEAEAVLLILGRCEAGTWQWLSSVVVEEEINNTPSRERRSRVRNMLSGAQSTVALTDVAIARAQELKAIGFRTYDALHLACAEQATVDIFLTTDARVLRIATRHTAHLKVRVANPLDWLLEVISPCIRRQ
jgi:predicted nucleic acid-binding protein